MGKKKNLLFRSTITVIISILLCSIPQMIPAFASTNVTTKFIDIAAGDSHSAALQADGTVWTWGSGYYGELGMGDTKVLRCPTQMNNINDVKAISAGSEFTLALKNDGTVWAWGFNEYGNLGNGSTDKSNRPVQVSTINGITAISAGESHAVALKNDGTVWAWGRNIYGQLGNSTSVGQKTTPYKVLGLTNVKAIAAGARHTVALKSDGTVWTWGDNSYGQLGVEGVDDCNTATLVKNLSNIVAIAAGANHTIAVKNDGSVYVWGDNQYGQLGKGDITDAYIPVKLTAITDVKAAAAGKQNTIFLKSDGTVWGAGYNHYGELGVGTTKENDTPAQTEGLTGIVSIDAGENHCLALDSKGSVYAWGCNVDSQIGVESLENAVIPEKVLSVEPVKVTLTAAAGKDGIALSWTTNSTDGIKGYNIYRSKVCGQYDMPRTDFPVTDSSFTDNSVDKDVTYYYTVKAVFDDGSLSDVSNEVSAVVKAEAPAIDTSVKITIILQPDNPIMKVNGVEKEVDPGKGTAPVEVDGRIMIPVRAVVEALGGIVGWNEEDQRITISLDGKNVEMWMNKKIIKVDGAEKEIDVAPQEKNDRTMVPVRFATANLGCELEWKDADRMVIITYVKSGSSSSNTNNTTTNNTGTNNTVTNNTGSDSTNTSNTTPVDSGKIDGYKYIYNGTELFSADSDMEWAFMSPNGKYVAYKTGSKICYYDIDNQQNVTIYSLSSTEQSGNYVFSYGFIPPYNFDFVNWSDDSTYFIVNKWTTAIFKGGSGNYKMNLLDNTCSPL